MDPSSLRELLRNDSLPWAHFAIRAQGRDERVIEVKHLLRHLHQRGIEIDEGELDKLVEQVGGRRASMIDIWSVPRRTLQWLRGRGWQTVDAYGIPTETLGPTPSKAATRG